MSLWVDAFSEAATETTLAGVRDWAEMAARRRPDVRAKIDYAANPAGQPKYLGVAPVGTAIGAAAWTIYRFAWNAGGDAIGWDALTAVAWGANTAARDALDWPVD